MMKRFTLFLLFLITPFAFGQDPDPGWGDARIAFYAQGINTNDVGGSSTYSELVTQFTLNSPFNINNDWDYGIDLRVAGYPGAEERGSRTSVYNAFVGRQVGSIGVRAGQIWLNELGSLGSIGGGVVQYKLRQSETNQIRFGGFGGLEPEILDAAYANGVRKFGGYVAFDGDQGRSNVIGYVNIRNSGLTERSVITFNNYIPVQKKLYLYQSAEVDLVGPGGNGSGGLNYFFINGRYVPSQDWSIFATYHHGRSIDARSITQDELNGRPIDPARLSGLLFESFDFRLMAKVVANLQVFGSYGQDRNNEQDQANKRITYGFFTGSIGKTGIDLHFSGNHIVPPSGSAYDYWDVSAGRMIGDKVYVSGEYASSVSLVSISDVNGITLVPGPRATLYGGSALVNVNRTVGLLFTAERSSDKTYSETRFLGGITFRFSGRK